MAFNDRDYTFDSLVEELTLVERHCRDGSFNDCTCTDGKHLPTIAGLTSEGVGFAQTPQERAFMDKTMEEARDIRRSIKADGFDPEMAEAVREWAREKRRRIEMKNWHGELPKTADRNEAKCNTPTHVVADFAVPPEYPREMAEEFVDMIQDEITEHREPIVQQLQRPQKTPVSPQMIGSPFMENVPTEPAQRKPFLFERVHARLMTPSKAWERFKK